MLSKTLYRVALVAGLALIGLLGSATRSSAQLSFLGVGAPSASAEGIGSLAYDDKHHVYLHVYDASRMVWGRFLDSNGTPIGAPFAIGTYRISYSNTGKVAYSRGSGVDAFFVAYTSDANCFDSCANVFGALVQYTGAAPSGGGVVSGVIPISPYSTVANPKQISNDVAFNPHTSRFMVAYNELAYTGGADVNVRLFNADGSAATAPVNVSPGTCAQGSAVLAFDWQRNYFMVAYSGDHPQGNPSCPSVTSNWGSFGYLLDGNTGTPITGLLVFETGFSYEPAVTYLPEADGFLAAWTRVTGERDVVGRYVSSANGGLGTPYGVLTSPGRNEGYSTLEYDPVSRKVLVAAMRDPNVIGGSILNAGGGVELPAFGMSTVAATLGSFYPVMERGEGGVMGVHYNVNFVASYVERFALPAAAAPGPTFGGGGCTSCGAAPRAMINIDAPGNGATVGNPFALSGWAIDTHQGGDSGVDRLDIWAVPQAGGPPVFVGLPYQLYERPDVAAALGERFRYSGFNAAFQHLSPGRYTLVFYAHSRATGAYDYDNAKTLDINVMGGAITKIDGPGWGALFGGYGGNMTVSGYAVDCSNPVGTGVDVIDIWAMEATTGTPIYLGRPTMGLPNLEGAVACGDMRFATGGYAFTNAVALPPGTYFIAVFSHSIGAPGFNFARLTGVNIQP